MILLKTNRDDRDRATAFRDEGLHVIQFRGVKSSAHAKTQRSVT